MQLGMSVLPPKADTCGALGDVRLVPIGDMQRTARLTSRRDNETGSHATNRFVPR
jgi:hypothetical protein